MMPFSDHAMQECLLVAAQDSLKLLTCDYRAQCHNVNGVRGDDGLRMPTVRGTQPDLGVLQRVRWNITLK